MELSAARTWVHRVTLPDGELLVKRGIGAWMSGSTLFGDSFFVLFCLARHVIAAQVSASNASTGGRLQISRGSGAPTVFGFDDFPLEKTWTLFLSPLLGNVLLSVDKSLPVRVQNE